ncbi:MAG TPA: tetratricopeptide repeat protein [Blastocatellia bacterium]|nr:tetratricopeptide repeat protein [Blastocatellia bacterium]
MKDKKTQRLVVISLLVLVYAAVACPRTMAKDKWIILKTANFNIVSNADESQARQLALKLEQFRYVFSKIFSINSADSLPVTVIGFKSDGSFKPFKPLYNGKPANLAGYFQRGEDENIIALDVSAASENPMAVIFHEYTHFLTSRTTREWPRWLMEGIAELYSSFNVEKNTVDLGVPIRNHVLLLRQRFMPLEAVLNVTPDSPAYNERDKQTIFYAEAWALTHYLMFGDRGAHQPQLVQFMTLYYSGMDQGKAFTQAFKTDYATMQKALKNYVDNSNYNEMRYNLKATDVQPQMDIATLDDAEVQYYLGDLLLQIQRTDDALAYFKQAAALDPKLARPYEGLGFVAFKQGRFGEAEQQLKQAVDRGSRNFLAHYYYAEAIERQELGPGATVANQETGLRMIAEYKKAIELAPGFSRAYFMLAQIYLMMHEHTEEALQAIGAAIRLDPHERHFLFVLAELQARNGQYDLARETVLPLVSDSDPGIRNQAGVLKQWLETYAASVRAAQDTGHAPGAGEEATASPAPASPNSLIHRPPSTETAGAAGGPTLQVEGARVIGALLMTVECDDGVTLVATSQGRLWRFSVGDPAKLKFESHDPHFEWSIACGPVKHNAFIYYKGAPVSRPGVDGDAVAIEFTR